MKPKLSLVVLFSIISAVTVLAQQPDFPGAQKEHEWLKQFTGEWTSESKAVAMEGQPSVECTGSMKSEMLGEFWVVNKLHGDMGGQTFHALQTIGYDIAEKKYVGTWIDTMMGHMWHYEGTVDDSGKKLVLVAEGPNFMEAGKISKFRDIYEFQSADVIVATSQMMGDDGKWETFMTGEMKRSKP